MTEEITGMDRRQFLKSAAAAGLALSLGGNSALLSAKENYDLAVISGDPAAATLKALEAIGGISRFVKKGQKVVLKPNMSFARPPEGASTTHPLVVTTVARACLEAGAERVTVIDHTLARAEACLDLSGIQKACQGIKGVYVFAIQDKKFFREVKVPQGKVLEKVEIAKEVLESDVLISIPVAKTHSATGVSMGIKGFMGLIWERGPFHYKFDINEALADLATVIKPQLTILDATRALVTGGPPWYGQNFKGRQVEHLLAASKRGLGQIETDSLKIFRGKA
ncbi:MAG: DUF362 domain-containing protein [Deltaproteobacteria bacterium]|nr:DUF362 domain-containing protein [Deltaproteobacteria bacterium]